MHETCDVPALALQRRATISDKFDAAGQSKTSRQFEGGYRPEIDGLRAVSVLAVFAFHLGFAPLGGGYVGVDVFFVISGYLITGIILNRIDKQNFSLSDFYVRRIKRIVPALLALIIFCCVGGSLVLSPGDYAIFGRSALYALAAAGNFFFLYNTGYFNPSAESMPLLHTWSLAVEEQFYVAWPIIVFIAARFTQRKKLWLSLLFISRHRLVRS
jgi:peptidoglycan/LPS O-acetylase OafA/YrhL